MLCLSSKAGQSIGVGAVVVTVLEIRGGRVRLGFSGPREIPVVRANAKQFFALNALLLGWGTRLERAERPAATPGTG